MKKEDAYYIRAFLLVVVITATLAFVFARPRGDQSGLWQASSYNPGQPGHKALYTTLSELGWPVARWQENYRMLEQTHGTMIISRNSIGRKYPFNEIERRQLLDWVTRGNRLLLFGDFVSTQDSRSLLDELGFKNLHAPSVGQRLYEQSEQLLSMGRENVELFPADRKTVLAQKKLVIDKTQSLPVLPPRAKILWRSEYGPEVAEMPYGRGSVVWSSSTALLDNAHLKLAENIPWLLALVAPDGKMPSVIYFEEAHHGFRTAITLQQLWSQPGLQLALVQMFLGLLVYLSGQQFRFGPRFTLHHENIRRPLEFVHSMGHLYQRARLRNQTVQYIFQETHKRVLSRLNLPSNTSHDIIAQHMKDAFPHLPAWKKLAKRFDSPEFSQGLPPGGWLRTAQDLIQIKKEMV